MQEFTSEVTALFYSIPDHRGKVITYPIYEVFFLVVVGIMASCTSFYDIAEFGKLRIRDFRQYMPFLHGIPSSRTIARIVSQTDKDAVSCLIEKFFVENNKSHIALDGKYLGGDLFSVSAFDRERCLTIAHSNAFTQGNELSGIKEILRSLYIKGCTISIDAIGCNKEIFDIIKKREANAVVAVKNNNKYLYKQTKNFFEVNPERGEKAIACLKAKTLDKAHGRVEERKISVLHDLSHIPETKLWPSIKALAEISSSRYARGNETTEKRYYAMTEVYSSEESLSFIRGHWSIENNLHWILDVNLKEDAHKFLVGNARQNLGTIRRIALNILKQLKPPKQPLIAFQRKIGRDPQTMHEVLREFKLTFS
jgi:predicted transposase YbfD/YdcC